MEREAVASRLDWRLPLHSKSDKFPHRDFVGLRPIPVVDSPGHCPDRCWCCGSLAVVTLGRWWRQTAFPHKVPFLQ